MITMDPGRAVAVRGWLKEGVFDNLEPADWQYVVLSILDEAEGTKFLARWGVTAVGFFDSGIVKSHRTSTTHDFVHPFLEAALPPKARLAFARACTALASLSYESSLRDDECALQLLANVLRLNEELETPGVVEGWLLATIAEDENIEVEVRRLAAQNLLLDGGFANTVSEEWWRGFATHVKGCPVLALPVISHYARRNPLQALHIFGQAAPHLELDDVCAETTELRLTLQDIFTTVRTYSDWEDLLSEIGALLSPAAQSFIVQEFDYPEMRDVLTALQASLEN